MTLQNIFYICASIGAVSTATSLIYLFYKDYSKSKKISQLERISEALNKDLELRYQPHLWLNGISLKQDENSIDFDINNKREWCQLLEFNILSGDLIFDEQNKHLPWELENPIDESTPEGSHRRYIFMINNSTKILNEVEYEFEIIYKNRLSQKHSIIAKGKGNQCKLSPPMIVN